MWSPDEGRPISTSPGASDAAVDDTAPFDGPDDEAGEIVLAVRVEAGHLRRLAAEQRAPVLAARARHAADDLFGHGGRQAPRREVIEEEERRRTLHEDVVHAVVHEIGTDGVVPVGEKRDLQLRADAVSARHQHRLAEAHAGEAEQPAEGADLRQHARRERAAGEALDAADGFVAGVDGDAGRLIVHGYARLQGCRLRADRP